MTLGRQLIISFLHEIAGFAFAATQTHGEPVERGVMPGHEPIEIHVAAHACCSLEVWNVVRFPHFGRWHDYLVNRL